MKDKLNSIVAKLENDAEYAITAASQTRDLSELSFWYGEYCGLMAAMEKLDVECWRRLLDLYQNSMEYCYRRIGRRKVS